MRKLNVFLALLMSVGLFLAIFEVGLRILGLGPDKPLVQFDERLGWSNVPETEKRHSTREFDVTFRINAQGLRDDPMPSPLKPPGIFRVLVLGDSFTLGYAVDREDLFVDQLERWWRAEGRAVEVINAGTEGYSTDQEVAWLLAHGEEYEPDLVLLMAYENDLYWNGHGHYMGAKPKPVFSPDEGSLETETLPQPPPRSWMHGLATTRLFAGRADDSQHFFKPEGGKRRALKELGALLETTPEFMDEPLARTRSALVALHDACLDLRAECVVVPIPSHSAIDPDYRERFGRRNFPGLDPEAWSADKPVDTFLGLARERGLHSLDLRSTLRTLRRSGKRLYNRVDWHLNRAGNGALASFLHDELDAKSLLPEARQRAEMPAVERARRIPFWLKLYGVLLLALSTLYIANYRDEPPWQAPLKVGALLGMIFVIALSGDSLLGMAGRKHPMAPLFLVFGFLTSLFTFIAYKLRGRGGTIAELVRCFVRRGHWYLLPLVVVLLSVGSLLVVAASSPLVAPFIYTLF